MYNFKIECHECCATYVSAFADPDPSDVKCEVCETLITDLFSVDLDVAELAEVLDARRFEADPARLIRAVFGPGVEEVDREGRLLVV
jgi:hypothetical protein